MNFYTLCAVPESQCDDCYERSRLERGITTGKARHQELLDKQSAKKCFVLEHTCPLPSNTGLFF